MTEKEKSAFALENTLAVYGIRENPFPIDETDGFFFSTSALVKQLNALRNLAEYGDLLLVISGVEGAGKSTFLNQFLLAADKRWSCCRLDATPSMTIDSLIEMLLTGFGVKGRGDDRMTDENLLRSYLTEVHANGGIALLAVDDAHLLPQMCTEFLLALAEPRGDMELRLLAATEPGRLGFSTNDPKRVHVVVLKPFDNQQCGDYLNSRLSRAGLVGDSPFSASVVDEIHEDSAGIPGAIHPLALQTLLANRERSERRRRPPLSKRAMAYLVLVLIIVGAVAIVLRPEPERPVFRDPGATGKVKGRKSVATTTREADQEEPANRLVEDSASPDPRPFAGSVIAKEQPAEAPAQPTTLIAAQSDDEVKVFKLDGNGASTTAAIVVTSPPPVKGEVPAASSAPVVTLAKNVTPASTLPAKRPPARDLDWLHRQDPTHYVIQLVGTRSASAAREFLDSNRLGDKGGVFATSHQGKPWYVVVFGVYSDKALARAAIDTLPERLRAGSPWSRSVASVVESAR